MFMKIVESVNVKLHFEQILTEVENGIEVTITRRGKKIAIIQPLSEDEEISDQFEHAKKAIRDLRRGVTLGDKLTIKQLTEEKRH